MQIFFIFSVYIYMKNVLIIEKFVCKSAYCLVLYMQTLPAPKSVARSQSETDRRGCWWLHIGQETNQIQL